MTIVGLLGIDHCAQLRTAQLETRFEMARIAPAWMLYGPDVKGNFLSHPSANIIKSMVGDDSLDLEFKNSNDNKAKRRGNWPIFVTSNSRLFVWFDGDYDAWRRRLVVIRYNQPKMQQTIRDFDKWILDKEGSGILNWCLQGVKLLLRDIALTGDICLSDKQKGLVDKLIYESDSLADFVRSQIHFVGRGSEGLSTTEITERYLKYAVKRTGDRCRLQRLRAISRI